MNTLDLVRYTARRGDRVVVEDVLAIDPSKRGRDATEEMSRRARACLTNFGDLRSDRIERGQRLGCCVRH